MGMQKKKENLIFFPGRVMSMSSEEWVWGFFEFKIQNAKLGIQNYTHYR